MHTIEVDSWAHGVGGSPRLHHNSDWSGTVELHWSEGGREQQLFVPGAFFRAAIAQELTRALQEERQRGAGTCATCDYSREAVEAAKADAAKAHEGRRAAELRLARAAEDAARAEVELAAARAACADARALQLQLADADGAKRARYAALEGVLARAWAQAAAGKGHERHATGDQPFEQQLIVQLGEHLGGSTDFNVGQAVKKAVEAKRLPRDRAVAELLGAVCYLAGAVVILERQP